MVLDAALPEERCAALDEGFHLGDQPASRILWVIVATRDPT